MFIRIKKIFLRLLEKEAPKPGPPKTEECPLCEGTGVYDAFFGSCNYCNGSGMVTFHKKMAYLEDQGII